MNDFKKLNDLLSNAIESLQQINNDLRNTPKIGEYAYFRGRSCSNDNSIRYGILEDYWFSPDFNKTLYVCKGAGIFIECSKTPLTQ